MTTMTMLHLQLEEELQLGSMMCATPLSLKLKLAMTTMMIASAHS
jgi:hypothetical protein